MPAYGVPKATPPGLGSGDVHAVPTDELAETWFVVFDGGGNDTQMTALVARERDPDAFWGVLTFDPVFVDHVLEYLRGCDREDVIYTCVIDSDEEW